MALRLCVMGEGPKKGILIGFQWWTMITMGLWGRVFLKCQGRCQTNCHPLGCPPPSICDLKSHRFPTSKSTHSSGFHSRHRVTSFARALQVQVHREPRLRSGGGLLLRALLSGRPVLGHQLCEWRHSRVQRWDRTQTAMEMRRCPQI